MGVQVAPSNLIGSPVISVSSNEEELNNARLLRRDDGISSPAWTSTKEDTEKFIQVDFSDEVTITGLLIQGGFTTDGSEAYVTSVTLRYRINDVWIDVPETLAANTDGTSEKFVGLSNSINVKVSNLTTVCFLMSQEALNLLHKTVAKFMFHFMLLEMETIYYP